MCVCVCVCVREEDVGTVLKLILRKYSGMWSRLTCQYKTNTTANSFRHKQPSMPIREKLRGRSWGQHTMTDFCSINATLPSYHNLRNMDQILRCEDG
jgi:hypothetical protein